VLAAEAQKFSVGVPDDPLVLIADDDTIDTCVDLTYAKKVLAEGAAVLDGLCGSSGTQINDATRRCLAQNLSSGAIVAVVRGATDQTDLVASCSTANADPTTSPITWSKADVSTAWRIDSVIFDAQRNQFTAAASRNGATATATFTCG